MTVIIRAKILPRNARRWVVDLQTFPLFSDYVGWNALQTGSCWRVNHTQIADLNTVAIEIGNISIGANYFRTFFVSSNNITETTGSTITSNFFENEALTINIIANSILNILSIGAFGIDTFSSQDKLSLIKTTETVASE